MDCEFLLKRIKELNISQSQVAERLGLLSVNSYINKNK